MEKLFKKYNAEYWQALCNNRNKCNSRNNSPDSQQKITDITDITDITESATKTKKEWNPPGVVQL